LDGREQIKNLGRRADYRLRLKGTPNFCIHSWARRWWYSGEHSCLPFLGQGDFYGQFVEDNSQPVSNPFITLGPSNWP